MSSLIPTIHPNPSFDKEGLEFFFRFASSPHLQSTPNLLYDNACRDCLCASVAYASKRSTRLLQQLIRRGLSFLRFASSPHLQSL